MSVAAIIPARGGSKGIPRKNLQLIDGIPLVGWSIRAALAAELVDAVYVSTEDDEIAAVAEEYGAVVIRRPVELATDESLTLPVLKHATRWFAEEPDTLVLLQCTSPFTSAADIDGAVLYGDHWEADVVASVCRDDAHQVRGTPDGVEWSSFDPGGANVRRQDRQATYRLTGAITVYRADKLPSAAYLYFGRVCIHEIPEERSLEIHSPFDLHVARATATYPGVICDA